MARHDRSTLIVDMCSVRYQSQRPTLFIDEYRSYIGPYTRLFFEEVFMPCGDETGTGCQDAGSVLGHFASDVARSRASSSIELWSPAISVADWMDVCTPDLAVVIVSEARSRIAFVQTVGLMAAEMLTSSGRRRT